MRLIKIYAQTKRCLDYFSDVGSGKTIVSLLSAYNTINSDFQVAVMAPTEILARQHFVAKKIFPKNIKIELLSGKSSYTG